MNLRDLLKIILQHGPLHAKWLNTLSYLENCGARKIAACEHPTLVKEEMLKHAAEEFRHAHYLKNQIKKVSSAPFLDYAPTQILGGFASLNYLRTLDLHTCRFLLKDLRQPRGEVKKSAYLLVTYAIEVRARDLYPLYHEVLRTEGSNVFVKSILLEEEEHLKEMEEGLSKLPRGFEWAKKVCSFEETLFRQWILRVEEEVCAQLV
jgi:hypothetical protein